MKQTTKERREAHAAQERARQTGYEKMENSPRPKTWSARMPAYCFTELCVVPELRRWPVRERGKDGEGEPV